MEATGRNYVDLESLYDESKLCQNPHKGWYLHYYDNGLDHYGTKLDEKDYLLDFPGFNHIYLRLAWNYLEPSEGCFNWDVIDRVINPWVGAGRKVAFRITCIETDQRQCFATPEWVKDAGASGMFINMPGDYQVWEPTYDDPVFLEKLEKFHVAFANRYGSMPWVEYIDIGSYGEWGEGHTEWTSNWERPYEVIKKHIDIYLRCYPNTFLVINDDFVTGRPLDDLAREMITGYAIEKKLCIRDDSISYKGYMQYGNSTLRSPALFSLLYNNGPVDLELEHYHTTVSNKTWDGGSHLEAAMREGHATFLGFHGYAREWLGENRDLAYKLANQCGYWYFLKGIETLPIVKSGEQMQISLLWENKGVSPAYYRFSLEFKFTCLVNPTSFFAVEATQSDNRNWSPGAVTAERISCGLPQGITPGCYRLGVRLVEPMQDGVRIIDLGLSDRIKDKDGYLSIRNIEIV